MLASVAQQDALLQKTHHTARQQQLPFYQILYMNSVCTYIQWPISGSNCPTGISSVHTMANLRKQLPRWNFL